MKETGLMFKAPLVRAILDGRKTQTRRVIKDQAIGERWCEARADSRQYLEWQGQPTCGSGVWDVPEYSAEIVSPLGLIGDRIYVRETFWAWGRWETRFSEAKGRDEWHFVDLTLECGRLYRFSDPLPGTLRRRGQGGIEPTWWKRPGILMPKEAARIWLEITGVRLERLQDISEDDAEAEGCEPLETERYERDWKLCPKCGGTRLHDALGAGLGVIHDVDCRECDTYVKRFRHLWLSTGGDWDADPWVWVIDFITISTTGRPA